MPKAKISIGLPIYNGLPFLQNAIDSISAQKYDRLEILVSDDGSTDNSQDLLHAWAAQDKRVRLREKENNAGTIDNFEWLAKAATGDYFMWAAQDDAWSPDYAETLGRLLDEHPEADLAVANNILMDINWQPLREMPKFDFNGYQGVTKKRKLLRSATNGWFYGLYRRQTMFKPLELVRRYGSAWGHDFVFLLPYLLSGCVTGIDTVTYFQRITKRSETALKPPPDLRYDMRKSFVEVSLDALASSQLNMFEKLYLRQFVIKYAARHSFHMKHIIKQRLRLPIK